MRISGRLLLLALGLAVAFGSDAQDDKRTSREREALRRAQQALRGAQEQQATLQRDKAALSAERDRLDEAAKAASAKLDRERAQAGRARAEAAALLGERDRLQAELDASRRANAEREQVQARRLEQAESALAELRMQLAERTQTVASLGTLLERSTRALGDAEAKNRELYGTALKLVDELRARGAVPALIGLESVRLENRAEELRSAIEAQRVTGNVPAR